MLFVRVKLLVPYQGIGCIVTQPTIEQAVLYVSFRKHLAVILKFCDSWVGSRKTGFDARAEL